MFVLYAYMLKSGERAESMQVIEREKGNIGNDHRNHRSGRKSDYFYL